MAECRWSLVRVLSGMPAALTSLGGRVESLAAAGERFDRRLAARDSDLEEKRVLILSTHILEGITSGKAGRRSLQSELEIAS